MEGFITLVIIYYFLVSTSRAAATVDKITLGRYVRDGETIVSAGRGFELGFFSPERSTNRYLGIWYKKVSSGIVAWVANRDAPLSDRSGVVNISPGGILLLLNSSNHTIWSSNASTTAQNPFAVLLESGNLVVKDGNDSNPDNFLWQSFDYPCHTLLPGMKLGVNLTSGLDRFISSWKSENDPAQGDFKMMIDPHGFPQLVLRKGSETQFRAGSWNGLRFTGVPQQKPNPVYTYEFVSNANEAFYRFSVSNSSVPSRMVLNPSGVVERLTWIDRTKSWKQFARFSGVTLDQCDHYALCGVNACCSVIMNSPVCECFKGFVPKFPHEWNILDWSGGCVRKTQLSCEQGDGFLKRTAVKLPDTRHSWFNKDIGLSECEKLCSNNCSCTAYANSDIRGQGSGCLLWFGDLIDVRELTGNGQDLYVRLASSEIASLERKRRYRKKKLAAIIVASTVLLAMAVLMLGWIMHSRKKKLKNRDGKTENYHDKGSEEEETELPMFDWTTIADATGNFSNDNKLGEGGFGAVYKGKLIGGQEIAVKRLSRSSGQGIEEFKNEVMLIAKLQHRNLVKLLGCCAHRDERMLIYEYMPNKSLDYFIFDEIRSKSLDWSERVNIIGGIARGLLYLHQDSRLRIIHRDLKASNVLLDNEMNPKISDFGLARTFGRNQTEANTNRVVGTYGYISPEYAVDGLFSEKSDVFSFGVLVLEIISGKKNRGFSTPGHDHNLLGHAWILWKEEGSLELIGDTLADSYLLSEVLRCIHVGLLCVQQRPEDRPNMSTVVLMLGSEISLPQPKQPGFFTERNLPAEADQSSCCTLQSSTTNEITFSILEAR